MNIVRQGPAEAAIIKTQLCNIARNIFGNAISEKLVFRCMKVNQLLGFGILMMSAGASLSAAADYLPLAVGNTWTYQSASTGETFQIQVRTPFVIQDNVYYALNGYGRTQLMVRHDAAGNLVYFDGERNKEILLTSFEPFEGGWWEAPMRDCPQQEGQTQLKRGTHTGAGGNWDNVLEIHYRTFGCADVGTESEQYAENIGMLRRVVTSFAGPRTFNLVYAHVGSQTIEAGANAYFSVSAQPSATNGWLATVRLDLGTTPTIRLGFPTSQLFDAVLRDEEGKELWRWSTAAIFAQVVTSRQFSGEWSMSFVVPHPDDTTGVYTLEGFLTNDSGPRFSGAVKVTAPVPAYREGPLAR